MRRIDLIADGLSNEEIAERVHLATHTVKGRVHNALRKLALHSRLQVAAYAHQNAGTAGGSVVRFSILRLIPARRTRG